MIEDFTFKNQYNIDDLLDIMSKLRGKGGCPWDAEQTHESIRKNLIEETYEVIEAIDNKDSSSLKEELGDVLMQVVFHTQIEKESGTFDFNNVCDGVCKKLIERHPHVFSNHKADTTEEVLKNWDEIKKEKRGQTTQSEVIKTIPRQFPALMRAEKVQKEAAKSGFDFSNVEDAIKKLEEEIAELREAIDKKNQREMEIELGDVFFSAVNIARFIDTDSEESLTHATDKFIRRFAILERLAIKRGINLRSVDLSKLDLLWNEAKELL